MIPSLLNKTVHFKCSMSHLDTKKCVYIAGLCIMHYVMYFPRFSIKFSIFDRVKINENIRAIKQFADDGCDFYC